MKMFIITHKKLCIAILVVLLLIVILALSYFLFRPKLSAMSDTGLRVFLWMNEIESLQDEGWTQEGLDWVRELIVLIEENPLYMPAINWTEALILPAQINKAVNKYYGRPFQYQNLLTGQ